MYRQQEPVRGGRQFKVCECVESEDGLTDFGVSLSGLGLFDPRFRLPIPCLCLFHLPPFNSTQLNTLSSKM
jgi:hypothetical protein